MKDISHIIEQIKKKIVNNSNDDISNLVKVPTMEELEVITDLFKVYSFSNSVYDEDELKNLLNYNVPKVIIDFYKGFSPIDGIDLGGDVIFLSLNGIKHENSELIPGALLIKYGFITIASTTGGNAICLDLNTILDEEPRIVIADKTIFTDKKITVFKNGVMIKEDLSLEVIKKYVVEINSTFTGFLGMLIDDGIDDIEEFLD